MPQRGYGVWGYGGGGRHTGLVGGLGVGDLWAGPLCLGVENLRRQWRGGSGELGPFGGFQQTFSGRIDPPKGWPSPFANQALTPQQFKNRGDGCMM